MNIIEPSVQLEAVTQLVENNNIQQGLNVEKVIEKAGRTCYKSEGKITEDSSSKFCEMIQTRNHVSVLEHCSATFRIICDRGILGEIVRHRLASYSVESTRYCSYTRDKKGMEFIKPSWISWDEIYAVRELCDMALPRIIDAYYKVGHTEAVPLNIRSVASFLFDLENAEHSYNFKVNNCRWTPQQARAVLPSCLKTEIVMTANFREWLHFLELRTAPAAHPDMQVIAKMIGNKLHEISPTIFKNEYK